MSTNQRIIKNSFFLLSSNILAKIVNFILFIVLTRALGVKGFGLFSFGLAYTSLFAIFVNIGINNFLILEVARDKSQAEKFVSVTLPAIIVFSIITFIIINGSTYITNWSPGECKIILLFSIYIILDAISRYFISIFRAYERMEFEAILNFSERVGMLIVALILWFYQDNLKNFIIAFNLILLLKLLFAFFIVLRYFIKIRIQCFSLKILSILKQSYPFALMSIFGIISTRIDTVMLKFFYNNEVVGLYNTAHKIIDSVSFIPESIAFAFFPALSFLYINNHDAFLITFRKFLKYLTIIAIPIITGLYILAPQIIILLFKPEFYKSYIALQWLALWLFLIFLKHAYATALNSIGKQKIFSYIIGLTMILNVILNYILIPKYNILGACVATVISEFLTTIISMYALRKNARIKTNISIYLKIIFVSILMIIIYILIKDWNIFMIFTISFIIYIILLFILKIISYKEINNLIFKKVI
jgi:O-antigen/teichoic acid export membrane protein